MADFFEVKVNDSNVSVAVYADGVVPLRMDKTSEGQRLVPARMADIYVILKDGAVLAKGNREQISEALVGQLNTDQVVWAPRARK